MTTGSLQLLLEAGAISPLSYFFARFVAQQGSEPEDSLLGISAALTCERTQQGDVCVQLEDYQERALFATEQPSCEVQINGPEVQKWRQKLLSSPCVGSPGELAPLTLDGQRLYLTRFWQYEAAVAAALMSRLEDISELDKDSLAAGLQRLFPAQDLPTDEGSGPRQGDLLAEPAVDWQKLASAIAVSRRFAVISGGPGTGKTTTVVKVLALLLEQDPAMRIQLAAPTGKAAARMLESLRSRKNSIVMDESIRALMPDQASTLHRLLSYDGQRFRHNRRNPLLLDCLVVDEASMIDLTLMARLLDALPAHARLILLGDRDQLASVDAGNVLGDITGRGLPLNYSPQTAALLAKLSGINSDKLPQSAIVPPVADAIGLLRTSYRFHDSSGIGRLARLINAGEGREALAFCLEQSAGGKPGSAEVSWLAATTEQLNPSALDWAVTRYSRYLQQNDVQSALEAFNTTRVLCAVHEGELGDHTLNRRIAEGLRARRLLEGAGSSEEVFHGKPIMITVNDYEMDLYNGDIGLIWRNSQDELRAWFPQVDGVVRDVPVRSLPDNVAAWALTVHKSQGSEFDQVLMVLPFDSNSRLLSRELVYTGVTRAREKILLHASEAVFLSACRSRVQRNSGLYSVLGWPA